MVRYKKVIIHEWNWIFGLIHLRVLNYACPILNCSPRNFLKLYEQLIIISKMHLEGYFILPFLSTLTGYRIFRIFSFTFTFNSPMKNFTKTLIDEKLWRSLKNQLNTINNEFFEKKNHNEQLTHLMKVTSRYWDNPYKNL